MNAARILAIACIVTTMSLTGCPGEDEPDPIDGSDAGVDSDVDNGEDSLQCMESMSIEDACGGDLLGTWEDAEICTDYELETAFAEIDCPEAEVETFDYRVADGSGTIEFGEEEMVRDMVMLFDLDFYVPEQCLETDLGTVGCSTFADITQAYFELSLECTDTDDSEPGCDCTAEDEPIDHSWTGKYEVDAEAGIYTVEEDEIDFYYCVDGDSLNHRMVDERADIPMTGVYRRGD